MATITGTESEDFLQGADDADLIQGLEGDDSLDGGGGADTLEGGLGQDAYYLSSLDDLVVELEGEGWDTVYWSGSARYEAASGIDCVVLAEGATQALGNAGANMLASWDAFGVAATLDGAAGDDSIWGGFGDDSLAGGDGADLIDGGAGHDTARAGAGDDIMLGEYWFETNYADENDEIGVRHGWDDLLYGDAGDDSLNGYYGDDRLEGGEGNDTLLGHANDDTYVGGAGADFYEVIVHVPYDDTIAGGYGGADVVLDFADGEDRILLALNGVDVPDMTAVQSIAQDGADTLVTLVDAGSLRLVGIDAALVTAEDFAFYEAGDVTDDTVGGGSLNDVLDGLAGDDLLLGRAGRDEIRGGEGRDTLTGGKGSDLIVGGGGRDMLNGGRGGDTFAYLDFADGRDLIVDFRAAKCDLVDISALDADWTEAGDQAAHFVSAFTHHAGEAVLAYHRANDRTVLLLDADGDGTAEFSVKVAGQAGAEGWVL